MPKTITHPLVVELRTGEYMLWRKVYESAELQKLVVDKAVLRQIKRLKKQGVWFVDEGENDNGA